MNESLQQLGIPFFLILSFLLGYLIAYFAGRMRMAKLLLDAEAVAEKISGLGRQLQDALEAEQKSNQELDEIRESLQRIDTGYQKSKVIILDQQTQLEKAVAAAKSYEQTIEDLHQQILELHQQKNTLESTLDHSDQAKEQLAEFHSLLNASLKKIDWLEERLQRLETPLVIAPPSNTLIPDAPIISEEPELPVSLDPAFFSPKIVPNPASRDDFTLIEGIGPFIQGKLYEQGIYTYDQLSGLDLSGIRDLARAIRFLPDRIIADDWSGQAAQLNQLKTENPSAFAATQTNKPDPDNLAIISGINPEVESVLQEAGIRNWSILADAEISDLRTILDMAGASYRDSDPASWPAQAKLAIAGQWELLEEFKRELENGDGSMNK